MTKPIRWALRRRLTFALNFQLLCGGNDHEIEFHDIKSPFSGDRKNNHEIESFFSGDRKFQ
jgi:hypothetical protein